MGVFSHAFKIFVSYLITEILTLEYLYWNRQLQVIQKRFGIISKREGSSKYWGDIYLALKSIISASIQKLSFKFHLTNLRHDWWNLKEQRVLLISNNRGELQLVKNCKDIKLFWYIYIFFKL